MIYIKFINFCLPFICSLAGVNNIQDMLHACRHTNTRKVAEVQGIHFNADRYPTHSLYQKCGECMRVYMCAWCGVLYPITISKS